MKGELLVKFKPEIDPDRVKILIAGLGTEVIQVFPTLGVYHLRITSGEATEAVIRKFSSMQEVEYAEPNFTRQLPRDMR